MKKTFYMVFALVMCVLCVFVGCGAKKEQETHPAAESTEAAANGTVVTEAVKVQTDATIGETTQTPAENQPMVWLVTKKITGSRDTTYTYDEELFLSQSTDGDRPVQDFFTYDEMGNMTQRTRYDDGEKYTDYAYIYDEDGNLLEESCFDAQRNQQRYRYCNSINEQGQVSKRVSYNGDGDVSETVMMTYNEQGQLIEENQYGSHGGLIECRTYEYDETGNNTLRLCYRKGEFYYKDEYAYDENGDMISWTYTNSDGEVEVKTYTYKYNSHGKLYYYEEAINGKSTSLVQYLYTEFPLGALDAEIVEKAQEFIYK